MDIADGLIQYLMLIALLTFHEFAHAWTSLKCGDDTARLQGRISLNPISHIDPIGTVLLPLIIIFVPGAGRFLIGWAKPVPFNPHNLNYRWRDEMLIAMAGPAMNLLLGIVLVGVVKMMQMFHYDAVAGLFWQAAWLSLLLCFFNLIPVPPLDGSHVLRNLTGMSDETYAKFSQFGFVIVIVLLQLRPISDLLQLVTFGTRGCFAWIFGVS